MMKRYLMVLTLLLALPALASAWTVNAKTSPLTGQGTIAPAGNKTYVNGEASGIYTVVAADGKKIARVTIDGVTIGGATPDVSGSYTVPYAANKSMRYIVAYFTANTINITTSAGTGGIVREDTFESLTNIPVGSARQILIKANPGYTIDLPVTAAGATVTDNADGSKTATYTNLQASQAVSATFSLIPVVTANAGNDINITTATGGTLYGSATSNQGAITYAWTGDNLTFGALDAAVTTVSSTTAGTYTATLTVTSGAEVVTDDVTVTVADARLVDIAVCTACHGANPLVAEFNLSNHNTYQYHKISCQDCHTGTTQHTVMPTDATCAGCHAGPYVAHEGTQPDCTSCHDPHSLVFTPAMTVASCATCHTSATPEITAAWSEGAHGAASGHTTGTCQRCHATEGSIAGATAGWTGSYATLIASQAAIWTPLTAATPPLTSTDGVSCAACHDQEHGGNALRPVNTYVDSQVVAWDPNGNAADDQYDVCTSCHTLTDNSGTLVGNYHDGGSINTSRTISDSHFDNPATGVGLATNVVEGYVVRSGSANPCADCHNVHMGDVEIQIAWANSAHAGKIQTKKDDAACTQSVVWFNTTYPTNTATACTETKTVGTSTRTVLEFFQRNTAGVAFYKTTGALDDAEGNAWTHYNWDQVTGTGNRGACARCHTSTGISTFLTNPVGYDATGASLTFNHLSNWTASTGSPQQELLYCWGCHSDSQTGELRDPGAITEVYSGSPSGSPSVSVTYPNLGKSNVCMGCHLGREVGAVVANSTGDFSSLSFINSHYLTAGSTLFSESGYEFAGQTYGDSYHKNVGMNNLYNTGNEGPCVTCHMTSAEGHSFEVSAASTPCANCHGGLTDLMIEDSKHEFHLALEELKTALAARGIYFYPAHPYFYKDPNNNGFDPLTEAISANAFKNWNFTGSTTFPYLVGKGKDVMGAAFNFNLFDHDPGAFAHNRPYALKLIQDSIDFLADGAVDGQGIPAAFTTAATNKEFAEGTSHPAAIVTAAVTNSVTDCGICHQAAPHAGGAFGGNAQFVANNAACSDCHANNDATANAVILKEYAESAHGDVTGPAWTTSSSHDWPNATTCKDCHSTTGYIAKVGGTTTKTPVVAGAGQTLACDACHTDLSANNDVRPVGGVTVAYKSRTYDTATATWNAAAPAVFPNVAAQNNICITCHAGRESGETILSLADAGMNNVSFKNPHYLGAAGMMYAKLAFIDFIDRTTVIGTSTYGESVTANEDGGKLTSTHRKLGTSAINGDSHNPTFFVSGTLDSDGPCVTCHMGDVEDHTWDINANAFTNVCVKCHDEEAGTPLTVDNFKELFIEEQAVPFNDAIAVAVATLKTKFNISYTENYPYFYDDSLATPAAMKDWTRGGTLAAADAKKLMGACLNIKLMKADPAAFVHSRTYARRVLYDTIDWLDDKAINMSTYTTAYAWDPVKYAIGTDSNTAPTTESTKYLKGYNRTSYVWNALERP